MATKKLAVIDGKSVFYRGYYAMPNLSLADGTPTGGVFGFASLAIELIKKLKPDYVTVAWDKRGTNIRKRREIYPEYKAGRKKAPEDFYAQMPILFELLEAFGWPLYELDDYEADDILGAFSLEAEKKGVETMLITSDLDALQLISPNTKVYAMKNGLSNIEEFDVDYFEKKYQIKVDQFLDFKSLKGDSSDNLPGVPGIGEKSAVELLNQYKTLDGIYAHLDEIKPQIAKKLEAGKDLAYMSKEIGRIWTEAPVELDWQQADINDIDLDKVEQILKRLEFNSLIRRLPEHMKKDSHDIPLYIAEDKQISLSKKEWSDELVIDGPFVMQIVEDDLLLSLDSKSFMKQSIANIPAKTWRLLELGEVVAYDGKQLLHDLDKFGVNYNFDRLFDIKQAAFLIDPLRRDRSLEGLVGEQLNDEVSSLSALWQVYEWQSEALNSLPRLKKIAFEYDFPLVKNLFEMERRGIKLDHKMLQTMSKQLENEHANLEKEMFRVSGEEFNTASPAQLSEVLFEKLNLPTAGIKKGKTGYSTGQKELDKLAGRHPIIELIQKIRELAKLKNTYVDTLPNQMDDSGRIHTTFNQDVAATGRLSSTNPNLQNIPIRTELGRKIREAFIPEPGHVFVSADYSQFELRLAAILSGDQTLIEDFNRGGDIHTQTASEIYKVPIDNVTKTQRRNAKVINFGVLYGMSPHGLSVATGMNQAEAKKFIDDYFELRAPIRKYIDKTLEQARNDGYVATFYGRRRPTPDIKSSNYMVRQSAERAAANMPIQGTEADLMKRAMLRIDKAIEGLGVSLLQIHDSILIETPKENAEEVASIVKQAMESVAPELDIRLDVDVKVGNNWGDIS